MAPDLLESGTNDQSTIRTAAFVEMVLDLGHFRAGHLGFVHVLVGFEEGPGQDRYGPSLSHLHFVVEIVDCIFLGAALLVIDGILDTQFGVFRHTTPGPSDMSHGTAELILDRFGQLVFQDVATLCDKFGSV
jgi:hypothetical protein